MLRAVPYTPEDAKAWDLFIDKCPMSTFLHSREFLSHYQGKDHSLMLIENETLRGVLPAATTEDAVCSHPGATYGGIIHDGELYGIHMQEAVSVVAAHYKKAGFNRLLYRAIPACYYRSGGDDDVYALLSKGARLNNSRLSSVIDLLDSVKPSSRRRRGINKASRAGMSVDCGNHYAPAVWEILEDILARRHNTRPTHSLAQIQQLAKNFPDNVTFHVGLIKNEIACGVVLFLANAVWHAQYIAAGDMARNNGGLDFLFDHLIKQATASGIRKFSFGNSNEPPQKGGGINAGLFQWKKEFGCNSEMQMFLELPL